ncbi:MAG: GDSL-type esterase/lipase family protein, partial [Bacteroidaceae bacterium]
ASLSLRLHDEAYAFEQIRVLGYSTSRDTHPLVIVGNDTIYPSLRDRQSGFLFHLPSPTTFCRLVFNNVGEESPFVVRGLMPISKRNGITYSESGINGASVPSWLGCKALKEELLLLPPDLVIFGIGINDAATSYDSFSPEQFKDNYRMLIERILTVNPKAALLFITNNDCNQTMRIRRPNLNTPRVEEAFKELAAEYNGCVFNLYQTMGGQGSAANWVSQGLMQSDRVHFTNEGYNLIGDLIYNAIIDDFTDYQLHKH